MQATAERPVWPRALWASAGGLVGLGVVGILTIGIFVLGVALLLAVVGSALPASRSSAVVALVPGLGLLPLAVGLSNLGGPGERCTSGAGSISCSELLNPWPFLVPGLALLLGGCWLVWRVRTPRRSTSRPGQAEPRAM